MSIAQLAIAIIVVCGVVGIAFVIVRQTGVQIPDFIIKIFWIIVAVCVGIFAIRFIMGLA